MSYIQQQGRIEQSDNNVSSQNQMYRVLFKTGQERTLQLSPEAVKYYQGIGVQVTPIASATQLTDVSIRLRNVETNQMQIGKDLTSLGQIDVRQDKSIAGYRTEFDNALIGRETNMQNIQTNTDSIQKIWDSIGQKADKSHSHDSNGDDCGLFGINCIFQDVGKYAVIAGVGIVAFFLLKKRIGL
tara:strand:- start:1588 stop:2142 length:555 start_codon:yes stop_codon:yes gene_type:complete